MKHYLLILFACAMTAHAETRWIEGILVNQKNGEPLLYVEYPEPQGGLPGEYFWLSPASGLEEKLKAATANLKPKETLKVLAQFEPDYGGHISRDLNGFIFEAEIHDVAPQSARAKPIESCDRDLYSIFETEGLRRPKGRRK